MHGRGVRVAYSCEEAVGRITTALEGLGFRVVRSFDLQEALAAQAEECPCPYHGTERCACSYTVLLVYGEYRKKAPAPVPGCANRPEACPESKRRDGPQSELSDTLYDPGAAGPSAAPPDPSIALPLDGTQDERRGSGHGLVPWLLVQRIVVHSHRGETWLTVLPPLGRGHRSPEWSEGIVEGAKPGGAEHAADSPDTALDARLVRGLAVAVVEALG